MNSKAARARVAGSLLVAAIVVGVFFNAAFLTEAPVFGIGVDPGGTLWMYDWVREEVMSGRFPAFTTRMYYPEGVSLIVRNGSNVVDAILSIPFQLALGPQRGVLATAVLILVGNALSMLPLARHLAPRRPMLQWCVAAWWMASAYVLQEMEGGRPTQAMLWFVPPAVLALLRFEGRRDAVMFGTCVGLQSWVYWYMGPFMALCLAPLALARLVRDGWDGVGKLLLAGVVALLVVAPLAAPIAYALAQGEVPGLARPVTETMIYVDAAHRIDNILERHTGITTLLALACALALWRRGWIAAGILLGVWCSLGVRFGTDDVLFDNIPYIFLYEHSGFISRLNFPERVFSVVYCLLACALLLAFARTRLSALPWLIVLVGLTEKSAIRLLPLSPFDGGELPASSIVRANPGPVLTVPTKSVDGVLMQQIFHRQPMVGGMGDHEPSIRTAEFSARIAGNAYFAALVAEADDAARPWTPADVNALKQWVRWIWYDYELQERTNGVETAKMTRVRLTAYLGQPYYSDGFSSVWDLRRRNATASEEEKAAADAILEARKARAWRFPKPAGGTEGGAEGAGAGGDTTGGKEGSESKGEAAKGGTPFR